MLSLCGGVCVVISVFTDVHHLFSGGVCRSICGLLPVGGFYLDACIRLWLDASSPSIKLLF